MRETLKKQLTESHAAGKGTNHATTIRSNKDNVTANRFSNSGLLRRERQCCDA